MQEMASQRSSCLLSIWPSVAVWSRRGRHLFFCLCVCLGVFPSLNAAPLFQRLKTLQYGDISIIDRIYDNITLNISF